MKRLFVRVDIDFFDNSIIQKFINYSRSVICEKDLSFTFMISFEVLKKILN
ncbi:hypothetical protein LEP1GSC082_0954 [Leptospira kirschneri str. H2]|uniref:Uncharacterized protein n=1 Tax=Leptospira kirschneri serovar Bulgarica str. Nikolaevo TaxID=1240687 RepID=M6F1P8_9LEPT|nr:hypothetical protein LEP1GSC082_0954 [Leptospira kirschneri str. H2]EMK20967.1 hypothetical protein LEP1GSC008_4561 [Leptospira kirschneri serovar Bulgarica str. Nikolaevo]